MTDLPFIATPQERLERLQECVERAAQAVDRARASHAKAKRLMRVWRLQKARLAAMEARNG